jgi:hypothetical protein
MSVNRGGNETVRGIWRSGGAIAFSQVRRKFLVLLQPLYRELLRKTTFSMERAQRPHMVVNLHRALYLIWFFTGSVPKMEEFVFELFRAGSS